jgi:hypothetical protein
LIPAEIEGPAPRANADSRSALCADGPIDFDAINKAALAVFAAVLARLLPGGKSTRAEAFANFDSELSARYVLSGHLARCQRLGSFLIVRRWHGAAPCSNSPAPIARIAKEDSQCHRSD